MDFGNRQFILLPGLGALCSISGILDQQEGIHSLSDCVTAAESHLCDHHVFSTQSVIIIRMTLSVQLPAFMMGSKQHPLNGLHSDLVHSNKSFIFNIVVFITLKDSQCDGIFGMAESHSKSMCSKGRVFTFDELTTQCSSTTPAM